MRTSSATHFQDVRLIGFDAGAETAWLPGDVLMVRPCNATERVDELFALFAEHRLPFDERTVIAVEEIDDGEWVLVFFVVVFFLHIQLMG